MTCDDSIVLTHPLQIAWDCYLVPSTESEPRTSHLPQPRPKVENICSMQHLTSLLTECDVLSETYSKMQKSYSHRLSKISLFISKIDDVRSLSHSGCRWLNKESLKRAEEIKSCESSKLEEVIAHSTTLGAIESDVAAILNHRMEWIRNFTAKSVESIAVLEKIYDEISSTALDGLESEEDKVTFA